MIDRNLPLISDWPLKESESSDLHDSASSASSVMSE